MNTPDPPPDPFIGVEEVSIELNISRRNAWELIKRLGVPMLNGDRKMAQARFRRSAWAKARDAGAKPAPPRIPSRPSYLPATTPAPVQGLSSADASRINAERIARLKRF